ncbi:MAG: hypothetical protein KBH41_04540 [Azonexus sp.]|nr:hypothetical protein [Azonexus sp.]
MAAFAHFGARDGGGEQTVGNGLGVGVGEGFRRQVMDQRRLKGFVELGERAALRLGGQQAFRFVANAARQSGEFFGKQVSSLDDMADAMAEGFGPGFAPGLGIVFVFRPAQTLVQGAIDVRQFERGIAAIPTQYIQGGQVPGILVEMGEGDFACIGVFFTKSGDEKQVFGMPGGRAGFVGRGALFDNEVREDAAQDDDGQFLVFEFDEEDSPRLAADQWTQLMDGLDAGGVFFLQAQFGGCELEGEFVETVFP